MGYMHIANLYKAQDILAFRWCWALEKVHGTSAHLAHRAGYPLSLFSGGENHERFVALFDVSDQNRRIAALGHAEVTVYGEAYGGRQQGMRATYGDELRFIVFDVKIGDMWLSVPDAEQVTVGLGLEFVPYSKVPTDISALDQERDAPSEVARRRGITGDRRREGVVLRPPFEVTKNNGSRIIAKHKTEAFSERATPQKVVDPEKLAVLSTASAIADEWVTPMRLAHVLDRMAAAGTMASDMTATRAVIAAMVEDIYREGAGELVPCKDATAAIGRRVAAMFKQLLNNRIGGEP